MLSNHSHPLRLAREALGLSMRQLAILVGLGRYGHRRVYGWEHGETIPTQLYAQVLAFSLGFESGEVLRSACLDWKKNHGQKATRGALE